MQSATLRNLVILALLLGGLLVVYASPWSRPGSGPAALDADGFTYVADLDYWQPTGRERLVQTAMRFDLAHDLNDLPLQIGTWQGEDVPETNREVFLLLEPEQFVQRLYRDGQGHDLWLTLIGSRTSQSFHPPDLCYDADGWQTTLSSQVIPLDAGGEIYGLWLEARKSEAEDMVLYFFLFPDEGRDPADGILLLKLTSSRYGDTGETLAVHADFLRHVFISALPVSRTP